MPVVDADALRDYVRRTFVAAGAPEEDAATVADHLVESNLKGHDSHGVIRVAGYLTAVQNGATKVGAEIRTEQKSDATALVDGGWNFGQVVARHTMGVAIESAARHGVGIAVAYRCTHVGRLGAYCEQAAAEGLIGIAMANNHGAGHLVAPFGGRERRLSTNPMAFGFPATDADAPFVLDMSTSVAPEGKVRLARNQGVEVPGGWLLDSDGRPTTDPGTLYEEPRGAILPLGGAAGHKGFGLSMVVEGLAGALSPAGTSRPDPERGGNGLFTMAIDPQRLGGLDPFSAAFGGLIDWVKQPPFQEGVTEVLTAGEPERLSQAEREASGIPLDDNTWRQLTDAGESVGVAPPPA